MSKREVIELLAKVLSDGTGLLGTSAKPWDDLKRELNLASWVDAAKVERALQNKLQQAPITADLISGSPPSR